MLARCDLSSKKVVSYDEAKELADSLGAAWPLSRRVTGSYCDSWHFWCSSGVGVLLLLPSSCLRSVLCWCTALHDSLPLVMPIKVQFMETSAKNAHNVEQAACTRRCNSLCCISMILWRLFKAWPARSSGLVCRLCTCR